MTVGQGVVLQAALALGSPEPAGIDFSLSQGRLSLTHHNPSCMSADGCKDSERVSWRELGHVRQR